jgi:hypothetical protein
MDVPRMVVGVQKGAIIYFNHYYRSLTTIIVSKQNYVFYFKNNP